MVIQMYIARSSLKNLDVHDTEKTVHIRLGQKMKNLGFDWMVCYLMVNGEDALMWFSKKLNHPLLKYNFTA